MKLLHILTAIVGCLSLAQSKVMVCYFSSWAVYRPGDGKFDVEDNDPALCTHLIYAFAGLAYNNEIKVLDPWNDLCDNYGKCGYDRFTKLKEKDTKLKTLLGVGGWNEGSTRYSEMAADSNKRRKFIDSSVALLKAHDFDGMDMDWEYPTQRGGGPDDFTNYITLLSELSEALHSEGLILTAAVSAGKATIDPAYDIPAMSSYLDLINLMTYDLHGSWEHYTHHHSCLYAHPKDKGDTLYLNVDFAVNYWLEKGAPKEKLVMGIPLYGRTWRLDNASDTGFYAPASQHGAAGPYTRQNGFLGYNEICAAQITQAWTIVHDPAMHEPYSYSLSNNRIWVSYEDPKSVAIKAQYALDKGLAGCMVWSVETDDFKGYCHGETFPLMNNIVEVLRGDAYTKPSEAPSPSITTWLKNPVILRDPNRSMASHNSNSVRKDLLQYPLRIKDQSIRKNEDQGSQHGVLCWRQRLIWKKQSQVLLQEKDLRKMRNLLRKSLLCNLGLPSKTRVMYKKSQFICYC